MSGFARHSLLSEVDELAHLFGRRPTKVDDDVGVFVKDARVTDQVTLQPAFVDEPSRADAVDLLKDRTSARIEPKVGVPLFTPCEVLAYDPSKLLQGLGMEAECR